MGQISQSVISVCELFMAGTVKYGTPCELKTKKKYTINNENGCGRYGNGRRTLWTLFTPTPLLASMTIMMILMTFYFDVDNN